MNVLTLGKFQFNLAAGLELAASRYDGLLSDTAVPEAREFIIRRMETRLRELSYRPDVVDAVLAARGDDPYAAAESVGHLTATVASPAWEESFTAYARCARIVRAIEHELPLNPAAYQVEEERELHGACEGAAAELDGADNASEALGPLLAALVPPINRFFDAVLVNAEEEDVRLARQALVQRIARLPATVADLSRLQGF